MLKARLGSLCFVSTSPRKREKWTKLVKKVPLKTFTIQFFLSLIGTKYTQPNLAFLLQDWFLVKQEVQIHLQQEQDHKGVSPRA